MNDAKVRRPGSSCACLGLFLAGSLFLAATGVCLASGETSRIAHVYFKERQYAVGTNTYVLSQLTNALMGEGLDVQAVALYGVNPRATRNARYTALLRGVSTAGLPAFVIEDDGGAGTLAAARKEEPHRVRLSTDQVRHALSLYRNHHGHTNIASRTDVGLRLEEDEDGYEFRQLEMKLPGRKVWVVHHVDQDLDGTSGSVELRTPW